MQDFTDYILFICKSAKILDAQSFAEKIAKSNAKLAY